jgi:4-hydroxy-L-threonine phosphate dehydrogenase PdxA
MEPTVKPKIAVPIGDPAGIGPEIVLRALADAQVAERIDPVVIGDAVALERHAKACGLDVDISADRIVFADGRSVALVEVESLKDQAWSFGEIGPISGRACRDYAVKGIELVQSGEAMAAVAAPHTETSVNMAGYHFRGYPALVAEITQTPESEVFLMLLSPVYRVVNVTLHEPLATAVARIDQPLVRTAIAAADAALRRLGFQRPRIGVCGLIPHAGEGGIMGSEDLAVIAPAVQEAAAAGINVSGPWPADALFAGREYDVYLAMYHDQGHVPVKVASPLAATAITIGTPVPFGSVAHGSALDIAGKGVARPDALINALLNLAGAPP